MSTVQQSTAFPLVHAMLCKNSSPVRFKLVPGPAAARCLSGESHHHTGASFLPGDRARSTLPAAECPLESVVPLAPSACTGLGTKGAIQTRQNTGLWRYRVLQPPQSPSAVTQDMPSPCRDSAQHPVCHLAQHRRALGGLHELGLPKVQHVLCCVQ